MSNEVLVERLLPAVNHNPADRAIAWEEWYRNVGAASVMAFVRIKNHTSVPDDDIVQEAIVTAYEQVEDGRYKPRAGIPLTAYVKGIARNKIREAHRRTHRLTPLDDIPPATLERQRLGAEISHPLETIVERRERLMVLNNRLAQLPPLRRQVIERYLRGHGTAEIAQAIEMSQAAVRQHKSRALRSLREPQH
jgi:RNA polymerase sigma factor (sigma-70 family)